MAEKIISPGVFTKEIDQTFLPSAISDIGACIIGPTVKGPALVPTVVTSFSDYQIKFGDTFKSGSNYYQYLTSHTAKEYLKHGNKLTVVRVLAGSYGGASTTISSSIDPAIVGGGTKATASVTFVSTAVEVGQAYLTGSLIATNGAQASMSFGGVEFAFTSSAYSGIPDINLSTKLWVGLDTVKTVAKAGQSASFALRDVINNSSSLHGLDISASSVSNVLTMSFNRPGAFGEYGTYVGGSKSGSGWSTLNPIITSSVSMSSAKNFQGGHDFNDEVFGSIFKIHTLSDGEIMNSGDGTNLKVGTNDLLKSGSEHNLRYDISSLNKNKGAFTLQIRRGDDIEKRKRVLETFSNINLDPNTPNYIGKAIGDQVQNIASDSDGKPYLQLSGSYPNKSKYVRVEVIRTTMDYLDENGNIRVGYASASLPAFHSGSNSGSFAGSFSGGSDGTVQHPKQFYENIAAANNQGLDPNTAANGLDDYTKALNLISNQDEYDINLILTPGIIDGLHTSVSTKVIDVCEDRGDCFAIIDPVEFSKNVTDATTRAESRDSNYAAMYWPWVKVPDSQIAGTQRWVPPSVVVSGVYAFNDKVANPWFAPAGLNRGILENVTQVEKKLTQSDRDTLYNSNVNPIATFPGQGVTVWGQKTLQNKTSALDRVNVRRLMIKVKKFIASSSRFLVFEQNTAQTRQRFLNMVNPFLNRVKSQSGLTEFRVVMDNTNNTPDTIDRNYLVGQIFVQPTRTAEFVVLDFTVQPTGATFPE